MRQVVSIPLTVDLIDGGGATAADVNVEISPATVTVVAETEGDVTLPDSISLGEIDLSNVLGNTSFSLPITLPEGVTLWGSQPVWPRFLSPSQHHRPPGGGANIILEMSPRL